MWENRRSASQQMMGANLEAKEERANGRRGAGRDQETVISQEEVQGVFPIDPAKISSHFTLDCYSSHHHYALRHQGQILGSRTIPAANHQPDEPTGLSSLTFFHR